MCHLLCTTSISVSDDPSQYQLSSRMDTRVRRMSEHSWAPVTDDKLCYSSNYVCVDAAPEVAIGGVRQYQAMLLFVKVGCGTL